MHWAQYWLVGDLKSGRATQTIGATEQGVAPAWSGVATLPSPYTFVLERLLLEAMHCSGVAVLPTSPAGGWALGRGKVQEAAGGSTIALLRGSANNTQLSPSMQVT